MRRRTPMTDAFDRDECYITPDGWCATHSTGAGPAYHDARDEAVLTPTEDDTTTTQEES